MGEAWLSRFASIAISHSGMLSAAVRKLEEGMSSKLHVSGSWQPDVASPLNRQDSCASSFGGASPSHRGLRRHRTGALEAATAAAARTGATVAHASCLTLPSAEPFIIGVAGGTASGQHEAAAW